MTTSTDGAKIRLGIIGANPTRGWATSAHLPALRHLDEFEVTAVSTTKAESARATADAFGVPLAFADDGELATHPDVDVVVVTVKTPEHAALVRLALGAGKHVFCEWPLGRDSTEAAALADEAAAAGVRHLIGLQGRHAPGALFLRELVEGGAVGQPLAVSLVSSGGRGNRVPQANAYSLDAAAGATILSISTGHTLATLATAVGELQDVSAIVAGLNREATIIETGQTVPVTAPDQVTIQGRLANGAVASVVVQGGASSNQVGFELRVVGSEAILTARPATPGPLHIAEWAVSLARPEGEAEELPVPSSLSPVPADVPAGPPRNVAILYRELASAFGERRGPDPDFAAAVRNHQLLDAVQLASDTGSRQEVTARR